MTEDSNIRDSIWNPNFPYYSIHNDLLIDITDSMNFCMSRSTNQVPTRYLENQNDSNSAIDLMFLRPDSLELDNHTIYPEQKLSLDHASLTVNIAIIEEHIQTKKHTLVKNSKKEENFIAKLIKVITRLNTENISSKEILEQVIQKFANNTDRIWFKHSKVVNITKHSKVWWDKNCYRKLEKYKTSK